jgi:hypothetical protein
MRPAIVAVLAAGLLAFASSAAAQTPQSLTLNPVCTGETNGGYFNYDIEIVVTGLGPWGPARGSIKTPDGFELGPTGFSADASGTARIRFNSIFPGVFKVEVVEPFTARERLYVDCGRPRPVKRAACKGGGWRGWGFDSRRDCFRYVRAAKQCAASHYQGVDVIPCPPRLPNE